MSFSLTTTEDSSTDEQLYTFEDAALMTDISVSLVIFYVELGVIEAIDDLLYSREIARIAQIKRLRQDLGLNVVGAAMVIDMAQEIAQLQAQLEVYRSQNQ
jgi:DNA-binding transcriptional MerR regulator